MRKKKTDQLLSVPDLPQVKSETLLGTTCFDVHALENAAVQSACFGIAVGCVCQEAQGAPYMA